jgi:hypothetical protein
LTNNVNCCKMTTIYYVIGELMWVKNIQDKQKNKVKKQ